MPNDRQLTDAQIQGLVAAALVKEMNTVNATLRVVEQWLADNRIHADRTLMDSLKMRLEGEFARVLAELSAISASAQGLKPPSEAETRRVEALSQEVAVLTAGRQATEEVIAVARKVLKLAAEVRSVSDTA